MTKRKLKSGYYYPFMAKYPFLRWVFVVWGYFAFILGLPLIFIGFLISLDSEYSFLWVIPSMMLLALIGIPYIHVRSGNIGTQTIELEKNTLTVINRMYFFKHSKKYHLTNLQLDETNIWNILTGDSIVPRKKFARLIINDTVSLNNHFLLEDLETLIEEYKTGANSSNRCTTP